MLFYFPLENITNSGLNNAHVHFSGAKVNSAAIKTYKNVLLSFLPYHCPGHLSPHVSKLTIVDKNLMYSGDTVHALGKNFGDNRTFIHTFHLLREQTFFPFVNQS